MLDIADILASKSVPEPNSGCWLWIGTVGRGGYGMQRVGGRTRMATHLSLELVGRSVPKGRFACHHCDVPACINPDHLFIGTQLDNIHDCMAKGRKTDPPRTKKGTRSDHKFCRAGHPRTTNNLYRRDDGYLGCLICKRAKLERRLAAEKRQRAVEISLRPKRVFACGPDHKTGANLYVSPRGKVECRACNRMATQRYLSSLRGRVAA